MTARMVLRLSDIVQNLVIQFGWRLARVSFLTRFPYANRCSVRSKTPWPVWTLAGPGEAAPSGGRRAWSRSRDSVRHDGRLAHNHSAVALILRPATSPIR